MIKGPYNISMEYLFKYVYIYIYVCVFTHMYINIEQNYLNTNKYKMSFFLLYVVLK